MQAEQIMDSVRFRMHMDDLARVWRKRTTTDDERIVRLQALLDSLPTAKPIEPIPIDYTPADLAVANAAQQDAPNVAARMDRLMQQFVLPVYRKGQSRIPMPDSFEGRPLPSSNKVWLEALGRAGINKEEIEWGVGADGMSLDAVGSVSVRVLKL